jgi:putative SOS response-associated peptidase YedK
MDVSQVPTSLGFAGSPFAGPEYEGALALKIWDHAETADGPIDSFTLLTSAPGPDQAVYHNRQPVILERAQWSDWLDVKNDMAPSFRGSPEGTITVERFVEAAAAPQLF